MVTKSKDKVLDMDLKHTIISTLIYGMMVNDDMGDAKNDAWEALQEEVRDDDTPATDVDEWEALFDDYANSQEVEEFVIQQYNQIRFIVEDVPWVLAKK